MSFGSITANAAQTAYDLAFQVSPIILQGGIYTSPMPIIGLLSGIGDISGVGGLSGANLAGAIGGIASTVLNLVSGDDPYFARFLVQPGGTLISNSVGQYPFANQQVAANAIIQQPKAISLRMICPAKGQGYYLTKTAILTGLQASLEQHNNAGGYYTIMTPAFVYDNAVMLAMTDITPATTANPQTEFQLDFALPLITNAQANSALSSLMSKITGGQQAMSSAWTGPATTGVFTGAQTFPLTSP